MSVWAHVLGTVRFDGTDGVTPAPDIAKSYIPCGSEGRLKVSRWKNPDDSSFARDTITIFGDLRDYENDEKIIEYFSRIVKDKMVRQACFTFWVEGYEQRFFVYDRQKEIFVETI